MGIRLPSHEFWWESISIKDDALCLYGFVSFSKPAARMIYMQINDADMLACKIYSMKPIRRDYVRYYLSMPYNFRIVVRGISQCGKLKCRFFAKSEDGLEELTNRKVGRYFPVSGVLRESYSVINGWLAKFDGTSLVLLRDGENLWTEHEQRFLKELDSLCIPAAYYAMNLRKEYNRLKPALKRKIWLISDRIAKAGDNGEVFFEYLRKEVPEIEPYFVINKDCPDYERLKQEQGNVLACMSPEHHLNHLLADRLVSSQTESFVDNPFNNAYEFYRDILANKKVVFIQHGVMRDDLSPCFSKQNKNLSMFVTSAKEEYDAILREDYGYGKDVVKLTGLPRYDKLESGHEENIIAVMPTWRFDLVDRTRFDFGKGVFLYDEDLFIRSPFFKFYNDLLNDESLVRAAKSKDCRIVFFPHPLLMPVLKLFDRNSCVEFADPADKHSDIINKSRLLITDYSSIAFDFAYLEKPVIYCQFDKETFRNKQMRGEIGFFCDEQNGFGKVVRTVFATVDCIIDFIDNGFENRPEYRQRAKQFFAYHDKNNCRRVYDEICQLS